MKTLYGLSLSEQQETPMSRIHVLSIAVVVLSAFLVSALPAAARPTKTVVNVAAGKPSGFHFTLSKSTVPAGPVTFDVKNVSSFPHTFKVCSSPKGGTGNSCAGKGTPMISPGSTATLSVTLKKGSYEYLCTVPGHAAGGMKGILKVT
jgi:uncharacterized cupredoxin-like copper-binding protein